MTITKVYASHNEFLNRENTQENGVSKEFAKWYPNYAQDNKTNKGCWNCLSCEKCTHCSYCDKCSKCSFCVSCTRCAECKDCRDEHALYCCDSD